jgi:hypothetical protein
LGLDFCGKVCERGGILARRDREREQPFDLALAKVSRFTNTPVDQVSQRLQEFLKQAKRSFEGRELDANSFAAVCTHIAGIGDRLPATFGDRFLFDSALIRGIGDDFGEGVALSRMIVPRHESDWGHERVSMPSEDLNFAHMMELIHLPGKDLLSEVDLLSYPWIIHELGHYILARHSDRFIPAFRDELKKTGANLRLGAIADRGQAKARAEKTLNDVFKFWSPTYDQQNWAHELTIDLMSLWSCGPAYLACFQDVVENSNLNPYELTEVHPPYAVRADALLKGAGQMRIGGFSLKLQQLSDSWQRSQWKNYRDNRFLALARPELVDGSLKVAFGLCRELKMPQCTAQRVANLSREAAKYNGDEIGLDLLLLAWFVYEEKGKDAFSSWEARVVEQLVKQIK